MFTDNHRRYLQNLLRHIEHEAQEAVDLLRNDEDPDALFPRYRHLPPPERIDALRAHQARLRAAMRRFMDAHGIGYLGEAGVEAGWAFETRLALVRNAAYELRPRYLRGYGELDAQGEQQCRALAAELDMLLTAMGGELRHGPLRLPEGGTDDALLAALAEIVERHRLFEYRSRVETLLARERGDRVEVALLGRVSSGKSSLVNAMLGRELLPVGAVPVTAVVTRIRHGAALEAHTLDADGQVQAIDAARLHDYVDESGNPGNRRRLREVDIRVPAPLLEPGIVLTDTPGLGSLHAHASAHALDYLPRCDLGIVAIDAAATLMPQDLDLLRALRDGGAEWLVALTKADTVAPEALAQQRRYLRGALAEALQADVSVAAISVRPGHRTGLDAWLRETLQPMLERTNARAAERRRQRVAELAARVRATLQQALAERPAAAHDDDAGTGRDQGDLLAALDDTHRRLHDLVRTLAERGARVIVDETAAQTPAGIALRADDLGARAATLADAVVRDAMAGLRTIADRLGPDVAARVLRGVPPFAANLPKALSLSSGAVPWPLRQALLRRRLRDALGDPLRHDFDVYASGLNDWLDQVVRELRRAALAVPGHGTVTPAADHDTLRADLQRLDALLGATA
jgi:GTP-binding protein EngB required for normal cell division